MTLGHFHATNSPVIILRRCKIFTCVGPVRYFPHSFSGEIYTSPFSATKPRPIIGRKKTKFLNPLYFVKSRSNITLVPPRSVWVSIPNVPWFLAMLIAAPWLPRLYTDCTFSSCPSHYPQSFVQIISRCLSYSLSRIFPQNCSLTMRLVFVKIPKSRYWHLEVGWRKWPNIELTESERWEHYFIKSQISKFERCG